MPLEATVICLDNSEYMRNGDYTPTRQEAQHDAVNLICGAKTQQNPESSVGCVAASGKTPEVLVTLTTDLGKMLSSLHDVRLHGQLNFMATIQVAQLVLKHRQNKNQHQRIIFFVGSPLDVSQDDLVRLAKRLRKNNIAVDVVNFGEQEENTEKLEAFINAVNNNDNSHLVNIPPGPHVLSDIIISSPIVSEDSGSVPGTSSGAGVGTATAQDFSAYGGVDPSLDPELALALKVSLEEARAREEADKKPTETATSEKPPTSDMEVDEAAEMEKALQMSMTNSASSTTTSTTSATSEKKQDQEMRELSEEEEMELALQMSMTNSNQESDTSRVMQDPQFMSSVLSSLPGVDPNDQTLQNLLANIKKDEEEKKKDKQ